MYKKTIAIMSVLVVVFLCSSPAFAATSSGASVTSNVIQYNEDNNNVASLYVRVNGRYSGDEGTSQSNYDHTFIVSLTNKTNKYLIADNNNFYIDLYTGSQYTFANTGLGNNSYNATWGAYVTGHSDNMTSPEIILNNNSRPGHVIIMYTDSDLLVLAPNETKLYTFNITFTQALNVNYNYLNGNPIYSYFTYSGSVSFLSRPNSFTSKTVEEFMANNSFPNNIISYLQGIFTRLKQNQSDYNYNSGLSNDVTSESNSLETQSTQQHQTELSYYNQTNTALGNTGLSNYSFNQEQIGGIGGVSGDFTQVFNSLGSWNSVYIFSLTLGLALMIIRHVRPIRRSKE